MKSFSNMVGKGSSPRSYKPSTYDLNYLRCFRAKELVECPTCGGNHLPKDLIQCTKCGRVSCTECNIEGECANCIMDSVIKTHMEIVDES